MDVGLLHDVVFYDGQCGMCQHQVLFVLKHDRAARFRFARLESDLYRSLAAGPSFQNLDNTVVVRRTDGSLLVRSSAALYILRQLGGFWRLLGIIGWLVPRPLRDGVYRSVARRRHRFGPPPPEACPVVPPHWRERFIG